MELESKIPQPPYFTRQTKKKDGGSSKTCLKYESLKESESEHSKGPFSEFKFNRKL
jgi:hypothetical protein